MLNFTKVRNTDTKKIRIIWVWWIQLSHEINDWKRWLPSCSGPHRWLPSCIHVSGSHFMQTNLITFFLFRIDLDLSRHVYMAVEDEREIHIMAEIVLLVLALTSPCQILHTNFQQVSHSRTLACGICLVVIFIKDGDNNACYHIRQSYSIALLSKTFQSNIRFYRQTDEFPRTDSVARNPALWSSNLWQWLPQWTRECTWNRICSW